MSHNNQLFVKASADLSTVLGAKNMGRFTDFFTSLGKDRCLSFSLKINNWDSTETLQTLVPLFPNSTTLSSADLILKLRELLGEGFSKFYQFASQKELTRIAQLRAIINVVTQALAQKLKRNATNDPEVIKMLEAHLKTLSILEKKLPKSQYAKKRNARIGKVLNHGWFAALGIFSWMVHLKNLGVHQFINPSDIFGPPISVQLPTQGFKYFYQSIAVNQIFPFFSHIAGIFNKRLSNFTRSLKGLKALRSIAYALSGMCSTIGLIAAKSFLSLYSSGISQFSLDLLNKAFIAGKGMVKFLALGALFGIVASSISAGIALLKLGQSVWKSFKSNAEEKALHQGKIAKRITSFIGNALMAIGFGVALISGPVGWSLLGAGASILIGLKAIQLVRAYLAKKSEEKDLRAAVTLQEEPDTQPVNVPGQRGVDNLGDSNAHQSNSALSFLGFFLRRPSPQSAVNSISPSHD